MASPLSGGATGILLGSAFELAAGYGVGQLYQRKRGTWMGDNAGTVTAVVGKGLALASAVFMEDAEMLTSVFNAVGSAGMALKGLEMGLDHGRKAMKVKTIVVPEGTALPAGGQNVTTVGDLPPAPAGRPLSWNQVETLAAMR